MGSIVYMLWEYNDNLVWTSQVVTLRGGNHLQLLNGLEVETTDVMLSLQDSLPVLPSGGLLVLHSDEYAIRTSF